ncbi:MAG: CoA transferase, partial [Moraxellaceae bacterium]|nr:CoA transferase [Moraxellaceae bacterium]
AVEAKFWQNFCTAAGRLDWIARHDDPIPQNALQAEIAAWFRIRSAPEIMDLFAETDCCLSLVLDMSEALANRQTAERELVRRAPDGALQALFPIRVNGSAPDTREPLRPFTAQARSPAISAPLRADQSSAALHRTRE